MATGCHCGGRGRDHSMTPMQKLIWPAAERAYLEHGDSLLVGPAVRIGDAVHWRTPGQVLAAYGISAPAAPFVDVLRFAPTPLSRVSIPRAGDPTSVAGYATGYLRTGLVPVWDVAATVVPRDAEIWRIFADGHQDLVASYGGPAIGWRGPTVFAPPTMLVGPRAEWGGREWHVSWVDDAQVELATLSDMPIDGCVQTRPYVYSRVVDASSCTRMFELGFTARWGDVECVLLQSNNEDTAVLLSTDAATAAQVGATVLEPGVFWHLVPSDEVSDIQAIQRELPRG